MLWCLTNPPTNPMTMSSGIVGLPLEVARREDAGVVAHHRNFWMDTQLLLAGFPPLLDPDYKLEADCKFCALHALAVNHARQRLDAFLWSSDQQMLPRS